MSDFSFVTADVFTDQHFGGNPLAVFPAADGVREVAMPRLAAELNLSETVFVLPPRQGGSAALRIFTPASELPFAGHPIVGTAVVLAETGLLPLTGNHLDIVFEVAAGPVPVRVERLPSGRLHATLTAPKLSQKIADAPSPTVLAASVGLGEASLAEVPAGVYSAGLPFTIVPLKDQAALAAARVVPAVWDEHLAASAAPALFLVTMAGWRAGRQVRARMFAPAMGIVEDPATGSAAAALAGFLGDLQAPSDGRVEWTIEQGVEMGRPSQITLSGEFAGGRLVKVQVGGQAVLMSRGVFSL